MEGLTSVNKNYLVNEKFIIRSKTGKIKVTASGNTQKIINLTLLVLLAATVFGFFTFDYKNIEFFKAVSLTITNIRTMFTEARISHFTFSEALSQISITLALAFLTTLISSVVALFLSLFAAKNLSNVHISNLIKGFVSLIRAVPTVLWVLIFAISAGLGSVAAIIGLSFHAVGYLVKAYSEAFEEIDHGVIEALRATGATWWQIAFQAVIPSTASYLMSWTFMRFEINFMTAVAMGAAAGAGGIGFDLFMAGGFYFDIREVGFITYLILIFAVALEFFSTKIKNRLLY